MVCWAVMFCEIVSEIVFSGFPVYLKLFLVAPASEPHESHVHRFGAIGLDGAIYNTVGRAIVCLDTRGGLWMSKFNEGCSHWQGFSRIKKKGS